jgi:hypothetical protein
MSKDIIYSEEVSSQKTELLFLFLTTVFLSLSVWRYLSAGVGVLTAAGFALFLVFLFYSINYRTLRIRLSHDFLTLQFGLFRWKVSLDEIASCELDDLPPLKKWGGAGIHWMWVRRRYRISYNFLEHHRIVVAFQKKKGWISDLSFSTRRPGRLLRLLRELTGK